MENAKQVGIVNVRSSDESFSSLSEYTIVELDYLDYQLIVEQTRDNNWIRTSSLLSIIFFIHMSADSYFDNFIFAWN